MLGASHSFLGKLKEASMKGPTLGREKSDTPFKVIAVSIILWWTLTTLLSLTSVWQLVELKLLDHMTVTAAPNKSQFPITIVGIDEASFAELAMQWPWPRGLHAQLVDRLVADGAAVVAFDIVFAEPSNKKDDEKFADAIRRAGNVVLAADRAYRESSSVRQWLRVDPYRAFTEAGAQVGLAAVTLGPDLVIRQVPESGDALWRTMIARLLREHPEITPNLAIAPGSLIRYAGGDHTFPYVSYHEVVRPTGSIPKGFFKDQVVIIGRDVKASPDIESAQADLFASPFLASTGWLTPGAEVHANILETVLGSNAITPLPGSGVIILLALVSAASGMAMRRWQPLRTLLMVLAIDAAIAALVWACFIGYKLWVPGGALVLVAPLMYLSLGARTYLAEQVRRREIVRTFCLYVTPQVVNYMIAHPEQIHLGGQRRNITLLFTDLGGFTTFSEILPPEQVANILNRHFTEMTDIVLEHEGTVVQFVGDAIMAFWGAPLDDDDQAYRAVATAIAMQAAMARLREEFAREGLPPIHMRIGVHSGSAVVGNLGSAKRLNYGAIGDDVNLAARLEGINKLYGTGIMISQATARQIEGRVMLRPVDRVVVKGRSHAVEVFTPCDDAQIVGLMTEAVRCYRHQEWPAAEAGFQQLLALLPEDKVAQLYLERINNLGPLTLDPDWDGSVALEKY